MRWQAKAPAPPRASRWHALVGQASACQRPLAGTDRIPPRPPYCTLNGSALLVPAAVATVTLRDPRAAVPPTRKVAVTVAGFTTTRLLTDMPAPSTFTVAGVVKLAPLIVTATVAPRLARFGVSELSIGLAATGAVTANDFDAPHGGP